MTPTEYTNIVVLPTVLEFLQARADRRLAYLSCIATYHMCDHVGFARGGKTGSYIVKDKLKGFCRASFRTVHGICNGTKHPERRENPGPERVRVAAAFALDTPGAGFGEGCWDGPALWVEIDGSTIFVHHAVQAVLLSLGTFFPDTLARVNLSCFEPFMLEWHKSARRERSEADRNRG